MPKDSHQVNGVWAATLWVYLLLKESKILQIMVYTFFIGNLFKR